MDEQLWVLLDFADMSNSGRYLLTFSPVITRYIILKWLKIIQNTYKSDEMPSPHDLIGVLYTSIYECCCSCK